MTQRRWGRPLWAGFLGSAVPALKEFATHIPDPSRISEMRVAYRITESAALPDLTASATLPYWVRSGQAGVQGHFCYPYRRASHPWYLCDGSTLLVTRRGMGRVGYEALGKLRVYPRTRLPNALLSPSGSKTWCRHSPSPSLQPATITCWPLLTQTDTMRRAMNSTMSRLTELPYSHRIQVTGAPEWQAHRARATRVNVSNRARSHTAPGCGQTLQPDVHA